MKFKKYKFFRLSIATVIMAVAACACSGLIPQFAIFAKTQFAPAVMRFLSGAAWSGAVIAGTILLITLIAGRWYCALLCPMGTLIDLIDLIPFFRKRAVKKNLSFLRIFIFAAVITLAVLGINWGFMLLDPYANFGELSSSIAGRSFHAGTVTMAVFIALLALWKRRFFCTSICPVGTFLNFCSARSKLKLHFTDRCVNCRQCEKSCPAGCIDISTGTIDNGRCVRCLACFDECKVNALKFSSAVAQPAAAAAPEDNNSRRDFIKRGSAALGGAVAGGVLLKAGLEKFAVTEPFSLIAPPGAHSMARLRQKCISCQICIQHCPTQIIRPAKHGDGPVSLDLNGNFCQWDCSLCSQVCPAGAIMELTPEEKQLIQISLPAVSDHCVGCGICISACPAKAMKLDDSDKASPDTSRCAGCGKCAAECPHKAITMTPVSVQKQLTPEPEPTPTEKTASPAKPKINHKVCFSCGACAEVCPVKAITLDDTGTPRQIDHNKCVACSACVKTCPAKAIK